MDSNQDLLEQKRIKFHNKLLSILPGVKIYYNPPDNIKIQYPAIIYKDSSIKSVRADNIKYITSPGYKVTYISSNPIDPNISILLKNLNMLEYSNSYYLNNNKYTVFNYNT